jgi:hypothetical protein
MHLGCRCSSTKGVKLNVFPNNKDFVAISINDSSYPPSSKLFCNLCNCNLTLLDPKAEEWFCTRCNISYYPNKGEKVKRANKFETPGPATDEHGNIIGGKTPLVAMVDDTTSTNKSRLPSSIEMLKRLGVNITDFHSTVDGESL